MKGKINIALNALDRLCVEQIIYYAPRYCVSSMHDIIFLLYCILQNVQLTKEAKNLSILQPASNCTF